MSLTGSTYGGIHRYEPARKSTTAAIAVVLLAVIEVVFVFLFMYGFVSGWGLTDTGNMFLGGILAVVFMDLTFILAPHHKRFLPDVTIVKERRRRQEDLHVHKKGVDDVTVNNDDAQEQVKRAVYPYYKR